MRILFCIAIGMVHAVQYRIRPWIQKRRALGNKSKHIEKSFPPLAHAEHFVRSVPMKEKGLTKQGKKPVGNKENQYRHKTLIKGNY